MVMHYPVSQNEYVTYTNFIEEVRILEKCSRTEDFSGVAYSEGEFIKLPKNQKTADFSKNLFDKFSIDQIEILKDKINYINSIHIKLKSGNLHNRRSDDCAPLAAKVYDTSLKTMLAWNEVYPKDVLHIDLVNEDAEKLNPSFSSKTFSQEEDEKALARYEEILSKHPQLKRDSSINDASLGIYQVYYDRDNITRVRNELLNKTFIAKKKEGLSDQDAYDVATNITRPGVVFEDRFWLVIRDVVKSPSNYEHTYNRQVPKSTLDNVVGAAALPIIQAQDGTKKAVLLLAFRHATNSWEFEIPRGNPKPGESEEETAKREVSEETGCQLDKVKGLVKLGEVTPDSGLTSAVVPVFFGVVSEEHAAKHDKTEAIKGKYVFTIEKIKDGLINGIEVEINGKPTNVKVRDAFLTYALALAQAKNLL